MHWSIELFKKGVFAWLCSLRMSWSLFISTLEQFSVSRPSTSPLCLCVAGWWAAPGWLACWLWRGLWSTGETTVTLLICVSSFFSSGWMYVLLDSRNVLFPHVLKLNQTPPPLICLIFIFLTEQTQPKWTKLFLCGTTGLCLTSPVRSQLWLDSSVTT